MCIYTVVLFLFAFAWQKLLNQDQHRVVIVMGFTATGVCMLVFSAICIVLAATIALPGILDQQWRLDTFTHTKAEVTEFDVVETIVRGKNTIYYYQPIIKYKFVPPPSSASRIPEYKLWEQATDATPSIEPVFGTNFLPIWNDRVLSNNEDRHWAESVRVTPGAQIDVCVL